MPQDRRTTGSPVLRCLSWGDLCENLKAALPKISQTPLIGGTAWVFSDPAMEGMLEYLFIDEAGQVSVANLIGMAPAAQNLVLIGDQMQLGQPIQGCHPGESGLSLCRCASSAAPLDREHKSGQWISSKDRKRPW